jgi:hypothetical protein
MIGHDQLADLTASWLRANKSRMTWTNFRYDIYGTGRPDVFSLAKSLHLKKCSPMVHEIKVSRSDFFSDVKSEKWKKYQPFCSHFYFVCPLGMVQKSEVPIEAGLMFFDCEAPRYNSFVIAKQPRLNKEWAFNDEFIMRLLMGRWGTEPSQFLRHHPKPTPPRPDQPTGFIEFEGLLTKAEVEAIQYSWRIGE